MKNKKLSGMLLWPALLILFLGLPFSGHDYFIGIGLSFLMWLALAQSWSVLSNMTGYISLGHVVFYGLGSYIVVVTWQQVPLWMSITAGGLASALFAALIGMPVLRVRGPYFVILTFGLAELIKYALLALEAHMGISSRLLFGAPDIVTIYWLILALAVASTILLEAVHRSRFGHGLRSLREDEQAAETLGVPVTRFKLYAYVLSAFIPGMVGGVMALRSTYFEAGQAFDPLISINIIVMAIIGGGDSARGPLIGVAFLVLLSEWLWVEAPQFYLIVLGLLMLVFVVLLPNGLLGLHEARQRTRQRSAT